MCKWKEFHLLKELEQLAKTFEYIREALPRNTRSGVKYKVTADKKEKQRRIFSDKVSPAISFTDDAVVQCECDVQL